MNTLKKLLAVMVILFFTGVLSGCGGDDEAAPAATDGLQLYDGGEFTLNINPTWKVINKTDFFDEIPDETLVAFTTPEAFDGFFVNVNVVKENLKEQVDSIDYGRANINLSGQNLTDYQKIQEAQIEVGGKPALLHIFEARLNPTEKLIRFIQLYGTRGNFGYIVSGGMLPDTPKEIRDLVGATVTSFDLRPL